MKTDRAIAWPDTFDAPARQGRQRLNVTTAWPTWKSALVLLCAVFAIRVAYLAWWSPYELVGDEAYYWVQSRHLDWCYNEKGPALPWMIAACCRLLGNSEWAVRLPVAISSLLAGWGIGRLAMSVTDGDERVGFFAVVCFLLMPAFAANAQICTQDGPLIALWIALTAIGLRLVRRWDERRDTWREWLALWFLLGIGFLFKQSVLLFLPSLVIYWIARRSLPLRPVWYAQQVAGIALFCLVISPMVVWNARHGWPLLAHTLGHLGAGGDQAGQVAKGNPLTWTGITIGGIIGAFGPAAIAFMTWASLRAFRERENDPRRWNARLWLMCAAWPGTVFFILLSLIKPVVPSWPLPSMVPLIALMAELLSAELARYRDQRRSRRLGSGDRPDKLAHQLWGVLVVYGIAGWFLISFPTVLSHAPLVGPHLEKSLLRRFTGHRRAAQDLQAVLVSITPNDGRPPPQIVTTYYMDAALASFYLPGHPAVATAGKYLGKRSTTFDQWPDTDLTNPALRRRPLLLIGANESRWREALVFDRAQPLAGGRFLLATNYQGPVSH